MLDANRQPQRFRTHQLGGLVEPLDVKKCTFQITSTLQDVRQIEHGGRIARVLVEAALQDDLGRLQLTGPGLADAGSEQRARRFAVLRHRHRRFELLARRHEAALLAARLGKKVVTLRELEAAKEAASEASKKINTLTNTKLPGENAAEEAVYQLELNVTSLECIFWYEEYA